MQRTALAARLQQCCVFSLTADRAFLKVPLQLSGGSRDDTDISVGHASDYGPDRTINLKTIANS